MKFGSELSDGLVPEWRTSYFDYKAGKKLLKKVNAAVRKTEATPEPKDRPTPKAFTPNFSSSSANGLKLTRSRSEAQASTRPNERSPLTVPRVRVDNPGQRLRRYGSIIGSPSRDDERELDRASTLELPTPAIEDLEDPIEDVDDDSTISPGTEDHQHFPQPPPTQLAHRGNAFEISKPKDVGPNRPFVRRFTSFATPQFSRHTQSDRDNDIALEAYRELDFRQEEFFAFLNKELEKIEKFYAQRERDADTKLGVLKEQLHMLRDQRAADIRASQDKQRISKLQHPTNNGQAPKIASETQLDPNRFRASTRSRFRASVDMARDKLAKAKPGHVGKTSQAMEQLSSPATISWNPQQDYVRSEKPVTYHNAKRKLKTAFQEFYRGLELLRSYTDLNKKAFRKINKKFDKIARSAAGKEYMKETIYAAHFSKSDHVEELQQSVEDLYARYFERGNCKSAISKLRQRIAKEGAFYGPTMRTGLLVGIAGCLSIRGLDYAVDRLLHETDAILRTQTSYLLQLYAGYFMLLLLVSLFCVDAAIFTQFRVNYQFIFEFNPRDMLNWKQLCELPAWFFLLFGICMFCNFSPWTPHEMYLYWPVVLIGVAALMIFAPVPGLFYSRGRKWFDFSVLRLLGAPFLAVEFRDFFLGDMFCSQTYALGNIELFFCLYANDWKNPPQCNSSNSQLLGFFSTLPGIIRLLQCVRRYRENGLWTHVANGTKYFATILQYMSLSLWRIYRHRSQGYLAFFLFCAIINSLFCSFWDLNYDWSMPAFDPFAKPYPFLRKNLVFRKRPWLYYIAMVIDPILRFNWIFYVIYRDDAQHSSLISFLIALSEVFRRGMWVVFRVENEHCTNVDKSKAFRDPNLPYQPIRIPEVDTSVEDLGSDGASLRASARDEETGAPSLRRRRPSEPSKQDSPMYATLKRVGSTFRTAHAMDYERKKPPSEEQARKQEEEEDETDSE